jgi:hypothetical protein
MKKRYAVKRAIGNLLGKNNNWISWLRALCVL